MMPKYNDPRSYYKGWEDGYLAGCQKHDVAIELANVVLLEMDRVISTGFPLTERAELAGKLAREVLGITVTPSPSPTWVEWLEINNGS